MFNKVGERMLNSKTVLALLTACLGSAVLNAQSTPSPQLLVLSKADLNFAFSADSMHYIFIAFASHLVLKEKVGICRWFGTALIVGGIILISLT